MTALSLILGFLSQAGLAAQYPGDEGIEQDPRVLFVEDFETGTVKEIAERWGNVAHPENLELLEDAHDATPGRRSLRIARNGHLYTHTRGVDVLHARFYVRFHRKTGYLHHFVHLIADRTPAPWPKGGAGKRPPGDQGFSTGIEPWGMWGKVPPPGAWHFYSYWHEMKPDGRGNFWGNFFDPPEPARIEPGRWYCVEVRLKANSSPEAADGEQAFWVDGKLVGEFKGIRWRTTDKLKINTFWLLYYVTDQAARHNNDTDPDRVQEVWFDDIVLATDYIGPVQGRPRSGRKAADPSRRAYEPGQEGGLPPPGRSVFRETFEEGGPRKFSGGEGRDGALAVPPTGVHCWNAFSVPVGESTTIRFRLKPLANVSEVTVLIWSDRLKDNGRYGVRSLKRDEWRDVEFRAIEVRTGWAMDGPSLEGDILNNIKLVFEGPEDARVLLDDFEVRE